MKRLQAKRNKLIKEFLECSYFLKGSVSHLCCNCHRGKCICDVKGKGITFRLTYKDKDQKTKTIYIPQQRLKEARKLIANYLHSRQILDLLLALNIETFTESG